MRNGLRLPHHANVVLESEYLSQAGAEDSLRVRDNYADELAVAFVRLFHGRLQTGGRTGHFFPYLPAFKTVFIDDHANSAAAIFFKIAHYPAAAIDLHVSLGSHHVGGQRNGEINQ